MYSDVEVLDWFVQQQAPPARPSPAKMFEPRAFGLEYARPSLGASFRQQLQQQGQQQQEQQHSRSAPSRASALAALEAANGVGQPPWRAAVCQDDLLIAVCPADAGVLSVAVQASYDAPLAWFLSLTREFDLMSTWNRYITLSTLLRTPDLLSADVYARLWVPWPFAQRSLTVQAQGFDFLDEYGCVLALAESPPPADPPEAPGDPEENVVECQIGRGSCMKLAPLSAERTHLTLVLHFQLHLPLSAPDWVLQDIVGVAGPWVHAALQVQLDSFREAGSAYRQRIAANPALYGYVSSRCLEYLAALPESQAPMPPQQRPGPRARRGSRRPKGRLALQRCAVIVCRLCAGCVGSFKSLLKR